MTKNNMRTSVQFFIAEWYENSNGKFELSLGERYAEFLMQNFHLTQTIINMERSRYQVIETKKIGTSQIMSVYNESKASRCSLLFT